VPFALTVLAPIIVNITAFHLAVSPGNYPIVALIVAAEVYLAWKHRAAFAPLFARARREDVASGAAEDELPARRQAA
jgi:hypothetical protein